MNQDHLIIGKLSAAQQLAVSFIDFLQDQLDSGAIQGEEAESLEVGRQCLQSAFGLFVVDPSYKNPHKLLEIFVAATDQTATRELSPEDKELADRLKIQGNDLMKEEKYQDAIDSYGQAINVDPSNAVYYCNRAAAYLKIDKPKEALDDCTHALDIDPKYSKAYGRMGLAYTSLGKHTDAKECYEKALKLDPDNPGYQTNLEFASQQVKDSKTGAAGGLNMGGLDLNSMMNNPALMNMAANMMANPQMQQMMAGLLSGAASNPQGGPAGLGNLLQTGQNIAQQLQQTNPELVEQLRQQMPPTDPSSGDTPPDNTGSGQP